MPASNPSPHVISEVWVPSGKKKKCFGFLCDCSAGRATGKGKVRPSRRKTRSAKSLPLCSAVLNPHQCGQVQAFTRLSSLIRKSCLTNHKSSSTCAKGKIKPNTTTKWDSLSTHYVVITLHCHTRSLFLFSILKGYIYKIHMHHLLCVSDCQLLTRWNCTEGKMHRTQPGRWYYIDKSNHPTV